MKEVIIDRFSFGIFVCELRHGDEGFIVLLPNLKAVNCEFAEGDARNRFEFLRVIGKKPVHADFDRIRVLLLAIHAAFLVKPFSVGCHLCPAFLSCCHWVSSFH